MSGPGQNGDLLARSQSGPPDDGLLSDNTVLSPILSFARGWHSFPRDWGLAIHWVLGLHGVYGSRMQENCARIGIRLELFYNLALQGFPAGYRYSSVVLNYLVHNQLPGCVALDVALQQIDRSRVLGDAIDLGSHMAGRMAGGLFTNYASTGGRFGQRLRSGPARYGMVPLNLILASLGALIRLAIASFNAPGFTVADIALAILTGRVGSFLSNDQWVAIYRGMQTCDLVIDSTDQEAYRQLYNSLRQFHEDVRQSAP